MRTLAIAVFACISAPAFAQPATCEGGVAKKEFVVAYNEASNAISAQNYSGALGLLAAARPHADSPLQHSAVTQLEIAALIQVDMPAAKQRMTSVLNDDPCVIPEVRQMYTRLLAE